MSVIMLAQTVLAFVVIIIVSLLIKVNLSYISSVDELE